MTIEQQVSKILLESSVIPSRDEQRRSSPNNPEFTRVNPSLFLNSNEELLVSCFVQGAIDYLKARTETDKNEYTMVARGIRKDNGRVLHAEGHFNIEFNEQGGTAAFSKMLISVAKEISEEGNVPIYCHTHVAWHRYSTWFSVRDLRFIARRSVQTSSDVYALLITSDGLNAVKYDRMRKDFCRVTVRLE